MFGAESVGPGSGGREEDSDAVVLEGCEAAGQPSGLLDQEG